jgi:hypothetical protein
MAVTALVLGIIGVAAGLVPLLFFLGWILGVLAIVFGAIARSRATKNPAVGRKTMATWGLGLGVAAIVAGVIGVTIFSSAVHDVSHSLRRYGDCLRDAHTQREIQDCLNR